MIDFNYYKVFYYVAKLGNFSLAAKELGVSQPAISYTISELEKCVDTELFIRHGKKTELTQMGSTLLEYVEDCFNTLQLAEQRLVNPSNNKKIQMSFGIQSYLIDLLPNLKTYLSKQNHLSYKIVDDSSGELIKKVENKEIEFAILTGHYSGRLTCKKIMDIHMAFISKNSGMLSKDSINEYNFALPLKTTKTRKILENYLLNENIQINPLYEFNSNHICLSLMEKINVVFYIPKELVSKKIDSGKLFVMKADFELPSSPINIIYDDKYISQETKKIIEILTKV